MEHSLGEIFENYFKFKKRTRPQKIRLKRKNYFRGKKTNFLKIKPRKGYVRFRLPGTTRYILLKQTVAQRAAKKRVGRALGKAVYLRKNAMRRRGRM